MKTEKEKGNEAGDVEEEQFFRLAGKQVRKEKYRGKLERKKEAGDDEEQFFQLVGKQVRFSIPWKDSPMETRVNNRKKISIQTIREPRISWNSVS